MEKDKFLFKDRIAQIQSSFSKDGWVTIYEGGASDSYDQHLIFCCLITPERMKTYKEDRDWVIQPGQEGKPCVMGSIQNGRWKSRYETFADKGIEPFLFLRWFNHNDERYIDLSEEFVLYFKLYEKGESKQKRTYYFADELGDLEEVLVIEPNKVKVKLRFLMEYISVRRMHFAICFDFMRLAEVKQEGFEPKDEDMKTDKYVYNHFMRHLGFDLNGCPLQSWIHGKAFIHYDKKKTQSYHFDCDDSNFESFITGYDDKGNVVLESCKKENGKLFKLTYFKKEVLNKYYNDPTKYEIDGWHVKSRYFYLKMDNHHDDYVAVFLTELGALPYKEQLHWKQYNITPQGGISHAYYRTMIEGSWAEHSETPDLYFKEKITAFNKKWKETFGWEFYKPLDPQDAHCFIALHIPTTNNIKAFCEQILALVKITIDSLNEEELAKAFEKGENEKGITKLEKYLSAHGYNLTDMMEFLRHLQALRSGLMAHRFSNSNKAAKRALEYFGIQENNLRDVATEIFVKSVYTINTLEKLFLPGMK